MNSIPSLAGALLLIALIVTISASCDKAGSRRIICFGDSLTEGPDLAPDEKYPALLEKLLMENGYQYDVINEGLSGDTTAGGLERIDSVIREPVEILILELGTNDALRNVPANEIKYNLAEMIRRVQLKNIQVVIAGIGTLPHTKPHYRDQLPALYQDLAGEFKVKLIPDFMEELRKTPGAMNRDKIHYKAKGAEVLAKQIFREIQPLLKR